MCFPVRFRPIRTAFMAHSFLLGTAHSCWQAWGGRFLRCGKSPVGLGIVGPGGGSGGACRYRALAPLDEGLEVVGVDAGLGAAANGRDVDRGQFTGCDEVVDVWPAAAEDLAGVLEVEQSCRHGSPFRVSDPTADSPG